MTFNIVVSVDDAVHGNETGNEVAKILERLASDIKYADDLPSLASFNMKGDDGVIVCAVSIEL
jgi:hypothetical protein